MKITELAAIVNSDIKIYQCAGQQTRWMAMIESAETKDGEQSAILHGTYGDATTPHKALKDYCQKISNRWFVVNAMSPKRKQFKLGKITA